MQREQTTLEDFNTHIFNGGLTTKVITDVARHESGFVRRSYKLQSRLTCLDFPMTATVPLFSVYQVDGLIKALQRTLEHMIANSDELSDGHKAAPNHVYVRGGGKASEDDSSHDELLDLVNRLKGK